MYVCMCMAHSTNLWERATCPKNLQYIQVLCTLSGDVMMYMKCFCENPVLNASGIMSIERRCYAIADIKKSR